MRRTKTKNGETLPIRRAWTRTDAAAVCCLLLLTGLYLFLALQGLAWKYEDEPFFPTIPHRLMLGDSLLTQEWQVSQLYAVLVYPFFRLFYAIKGTTAGVILFFRYLFIFFQMTVCAVLYTKLRKYGGWGLAAVVLFSLLWRPIDTLALDYYAICLMASALLFATLFLQKEHGAARLIFCGVLLSCAVLAQPFAALIYVVYSALVLCGVCRKKILLREESDVFTARAWRWLSLGVALCAAGFFVFLFCRTTPRQLLAVLPQLTSDPLYPLFDSDTNLGIISVTPYLRMAKGVGYIVSALPPISLLVAAADQNRRAHRRAHLIVMSVCTALWMLVAVIAFAKQKISFGKVYPLAALALFGFGCYLLTEKKNRSHLAFWIGGMLLSVAMDLCSDVYRGHGAAVVLLPSFLMARDLVKELRGAAKERKVPATARRKKERSLPARRCACWQRRSSYCRARSSAKRCFGARSASALNRSRSDRTRGSAIPKINIRTSWICLPIWTGSRRRRTAWSISRHCTPPRICIWSARTPAIRLGSSRAISRRGRRRTGSCTRTSARVASMCRATPRRSRRRWCRRSERCVTLKRRRAPPGGSYGSGRGTCRDRKSIRQKGRKPSMRKTKTLTNRKAWSWTDTVAVCCLWRRAACAGAIRMRPAFCPCRTAICAATAF